MKSFVKTMILSATMMFAASNGVIASDFTLTSQAEISPLHLGESGNPSEKGCIVKSMQHDLAFFVAPIQSVQALGEYVRHLPKNSPLRALGSKEREAFVSSVTFNDTGVTGYRSDILESHLSVSQAYRILSLVGDQHNTTLLSNLRVDTDLDQSIVDLLGQDQASAKCDGGDYHGMKCDARATCKVASGYICKSNC